MRNNGFSLVELLLTLTLLSIVITYGYISFSDSRVAVEAETDRQYILKIPVLLEQVYANKLSYPGHLGEIINTNSANFLTPGNYYLLSYRRVTKNNYILTAKLNPGKKYTDKVKCVVITINEAGKLSAFDNAGNPISSECWK